MIIVNILKYFLVFIISAIVCGTFFLLQTEKGWQDYTYFNDLFQYLSCNYQEHFYCFLSPFKNLIPIAARVDVPPEQGEHGRVLAPRAHQEPAL
jgi:hypothetical protein